MSKNENKPQQNSLPHSAAQDSAPPAPVSRQEYEAQQARLAQLEKALAQATALQERAEAHNTSAVRAEGAKTTRVRLYGLHTGCRYTDVDDGYDIQDGKIKPHAGRARIIEMLERRATDKSGDEHPVFCLLERVAPRYAGDPIARAPVYGVNHDKRAEAALVEQKRARDKAVRSKALMQREEAITRIRAALASEASQ